MSPWTVFIAVSCALSLPLSTTAPPSVEPGEELEAGEAPAGEQEPTPIVHDPDEALRKEAHDRFNDGNNLFFERRYLEAATEYQRSYAALPSGKALYNLGFAFERGGDFVNALDVYNRYLALPDCPTPDHHCADHRAEIERIRYELRDKVGTLAITLDDGVELQGIEIGDRIIPPGDFPLVLAPGHYELRVRGIRRQDVRTREVDVEAGRITSLLIPTFSALEPRVDPPKRRERDEDDTVPPPNRLDQAERRRRLRIAFFGGVGLTAAAGIATGVVGGFTLQAYRRYDRRCKGEGVDCTGTVRPAEAEQRFGTLQPATNALVGVTAALGITTVVLGLFAFSDRKGPSTRASTRVTPAPGGLAIEF